jgi:hypothetical protein
VLDASALLRLYLADGPLPERLEEAAELVAELQRLPLRTMASMDLCSTVLQLSQVQRISVYDATYLAWPCATGPLCSPLISSWMERLKEPVAEAEGSRARGRRCSAHETATNVSPTLAGLAVARQSAPASMASPLPSDTAV